MKLYQTDKNSIFYTRDRLTCAVCKKFVRDLLSVRDKDQFCKKCFHSELPFLFDDEQEFLYLRQIVDVEFEKRKETKRKERNSLTLKLRFSILQRDKFSCVSCGKNAKDVELEIDHIDPVSNGGKTVASNLQTLCFSCNRGKGNTGYKHQNL